MISLQSIHKKLPVLLLIVLSIWGTTHYSIAYAEGVRENLLKASDKKANGEYVRKHFLSLMKVPFDKADTRKKALIIGDSHGQDILNAITENNYLRHYQIRTRYVPVRCQIFLDSKLSRFIAAKDIAFCNQSDSLTKMRQQIAQADLIILAANWKEWSARHLSQSIQGLNLHAQQKVIVLGKKSFGKITIRKYMRMSENDLRTLRNKVDANQMKINNILKSTLSAKTYVDVHQLLCGSQGTCPVFTNDLKLISFDGGHLTKAGARHVGKILFQKSVLGRL